MKNTPWNVLIMVFNAVATVGFADGLVMLNAFKFTQLPPQMRPVPMSASPSCEPSSFCAVLKNLSSTRSSFPSLSSSTSTNDGSPSLSASAPALFSVGSANLRTPAPLTPVPLPRFARAGGFPPLTAIDRLSTAEDGAAFARLANV